MQFGDWRLPRQRWAAWVVISFLANAVAMGGFAAASHRVLAGEYCSSAKPPERLGKKSLDLELTPSRAATILALHTPQAPCIESWVRANLYADFLFIPSYSSLLAFAVFLFSSPRAAGEPAGWSWRGCAVLLAIVMAAADVTENRQLLRLLYRLPAPLLPWPTTIKWWAIALALALAGCLALARREAGRVLPWLTGAAGLLTGAALAIGISASWKGWVQLAAELGVPAFFLLVLIEAVVSMAKAGLPESGRERAA